MTAGSRTVYVVDDDALVTESLSRALELESPWHVRSFMRGREALGAMETDPPHVVLSDFKMPEMDGLAFLSAVRKRFPEAVLLLLTGYADKESAIQAINEVGIWQYVEKPWDLGDLLLKIRQGLERQELVIELKSKNDMLEARLSELERTRDELVRAQSLAAVGRVVSGLAHELGNQLALVGYAQVITEDPEGAQVGDFARTIVAAQRRMAAMVEEIKDFTRGASTDLKREPADLSRALEEAVDLLQFDPDVKGHALQLKIEARPIVLMHRGKMEQVAVNFVRNAAQASPAGAPIAIVVGQDANGPFFRVHDQGAGMDPPTVARLGEPFFTTKERGSGLGYSISRKIVEEHGGRVDVTSKTGEGTQITVRLPERQG